MIVPIADNLWKTQNQDDLKDIAKPFPVPQETDLTFVLEEDVRALMMTQEIHPCMQ